MRHALALCLCLLPVPLAAQVEDPAMEAQRCVWACLANSPGAGSAEYNACVAARCSDEGVEPEGAVWSHGRTGDGQGMFAGVADPASGNQFYYLCTPDGRGFLALYGPEGPAAMLDVAVDGQSHPLPFTPEGGGHYAPVTPDAQVMGALSRGARVQVLNGQRYALIDAGLSGAAAALSQAMAACR